MLRSMQFSESARWHAKVRDEYSRVSYMPTSTDADSVIMFSIYVRLPCDIHNMIIQMPVSIKLQDNGLLLTVKADACISEQ